MQNLQNNHGLPTGFAAQGRSRTHVTGTGTRYRYRYGSRGDVRAIGTRYPYRTMMSRPGTRYLALGTGKIDSSIRNKRGY